MLRRIDGSELQNVDLAPQAVIRMSVADFRKQSGTTFESGSDDLNRYEAACGMSFSALSAFTGASFSTSSALVSRCKKLLSLTGLPLWPCCAWFKTPL